MVTTIREGVFETNSSSTHSITIKPVSDSETIIGNVLYPEKLHSILLEDNRILSCSTIPDKIMLLAHWVKDLNISGLCETLDWLSSYKIDWNFEVNYTSFDDDFNYEDKINTPEKLTEFFNNYINNEDFIITDSYIRW